MQVTMQQRQQDAAGRGWFMLLLAGLFVGLRLGGVTDWQWYWVLAPVWANVILAIFLGEDQGEGFFQLLTGLFVGLRLGGVTHWWWGWIFAPLWLPIVTSTVSLVIFLGTSLSMRDR
jgi:hypothetical protein